jgi:hypothetical protein
LVEGEVLGSGVVDLGGVGEVSGEALLYVEKTELQSLVFIHSGLGLR